MNAEVSYFYNKCKNEKLNEDIINRLCTVVDNSIVYADKTNFRSFLLSGFNSVIEYSRTNNSLSNKEISFIYSMIDLLYTYRNHKGGTR